MLQKYFIALIPTEPVFSEIESIKKEVSLKYNNKSALRSPPHITLHMPFEWKSDKETVLTDALEKFKFSDSIPLQLKGFSGFEPRVVFIDVVPIQALVSLRSGLVSHVKQQLKIFNQSNDTRAFHPHITIAFRDLKKSAFYAMMEEYKDKTFEAVINTSSLFLLKHSGKYWNIYKEFKFTT